MFNWTDAFLAVGILIVLFVAVIIFTIIANIIEDRKGEGAAFLFKLISVLLLVFLVAGFTTESKADDTYIRYAINAFGPPTDVKALSIGHIYDTHVFQGRLEAGAMSDMRVESGFTGFGIGSIGIAPSYGPLFLTFHQGIALLTNPDNKYLSGNFQFVEDLGLGFRGTNDTALVFSYRHMSNGGLMQPNLGKDMFGLEVRIGE